MPTFYYQPSLYLYDQIEKLICPNTWTLSSGTPLTDWRSSSVLQSCRVTVHGCFCVLSSGRKGSEVLTLPMSHASAFRHGCEDQLVCGGLIQNGNEWAKILWVRGEEEHISLVPGFFQVIISPIVLTIKQFLVLLISKAYYIKLHFFTCESKLRNIE